MGYSIVQNYQQYFSLLLYLVKLIALLQRTLYKKIEEQLL